MIETYAFLTMFAIQILAGSVVCPRLFIRRVRADTKAFPDERFRELFPGKDKLASTERFVRRYRAQNTAIAVFGLILLGWLFYYLRRPGWNEPTVVLLITIELLAQMVPHFLISRMAAKYNKQLLAASADGKRTAVLQRRGLLDFVSPLSILLAVLSYVFLAALVIYIRMHPFPGFGGLINLGVVTLSYAVMAIVAYRIIYGRKRNPMLRHADRLFAIGVAVKTFIYTCIGLTVFTSVVLTLGLLHLRSWNLFAVGVFYVLAVLTPNIVTAIVRRQPKVELPGADGPRPAPAGTT
jgi:hypothetical protein